MISTSGWVQILAAEQTPRSTDWYQGTADAVRKQLFEIKATGADYVLILAGDHLYRMDYGSMAEFHWECQADITVAVQPVAAVRFTPFRPAQAQPRPAHRRLRGEAARPRHPGAVCQPR